MKRLLCLFTAIIIIMSLAACGKNDAESGSDGQEISKAEISRQDEQSSEGESSFVEASEPVSEEASEPVSEVSEPQQSIDDEPSTEYRVIDAYSAENLREKLTELAQKIDDPSTVMTIAERELYAPLSAILAEGYIINPIIGDTQIESAPEDPYGALEMIFFKNHKVSLTYYCRNSDKVSANVQITYPNEEMLGMIQKHGIDGYRMFYAGNEKTADKLTAEEVEKTGFSSISVCEISCSGEKYEAIKYVKNIKGDYNRVVFMHDGKVFVITYLYIDDDFAATHDVDDILDTIKLEKLYFDESSEDVSRDEPQPSIDPEDFPYRVVSAHSAEELVNKLKEANEKINGDKASDFNMKDIDYLAPLSGILAQGFIFNPSVDGIYAENDTSESHGKIEMVFDDNNLVTVIYYCRNDDDVWAMLQITYPNADVTRLISQYGAEGFGMYNANSDIRITEMTEQQKADSGFTNASIETISIDGEAYEAMKYARSSGGNCVTIVYDGFVVVISYKYTNQEYAATHDADEILDTIKLEKLYFDGQPRDESPTTPDCTYGQAENYPIFGAYDASGLVDNLIEINEQLKNGTAPLYDPSYYVCMKQILSDGYVLNPTFNGEYAKNAFDYPPVEIDFIPILTVISYDFSTKECIFRINAMYPEGKNATNISKYGIEGFAMSIFDCPDTPLDKMPEDKINYVCASAEIKTINVGGNDYTALICTNMWGMRDTAAFLYEGKIIEIEFEPRNGCRETLESLLGKVGLEKYGFASDR